MSVFTQKPAVFQADVILHAFDWPYQKVTEEAERIAQLGYQSVLISPPMKSPDEEKWWMRYQPQDYRVIDNPLGNTLDFIAMIEALKQQKIKIYVDVVFNHMANEAYLRSDLNYPNQTILAQYQAQPEHYERLRLFGNLSQPLFTNNDFEAAFPIKNWLDVKEVQTGRLSGSDTDPGLPTLAPTDNVIKQQQHYICALKKLGVNGFRIDAAKHLSAQHIEKVWTPNICADVRVFGEIITDGGVGKAEYEIFLQPFVKHTSFDAYDFPLFHSILNVFEHNTSMKSLLSVAENGQCLASDRAITFAVTHDIPNNDIFRNQLMSPQHEQLAYCYLLGACDGSPLIYTDLNTSNDYDSLGHPRWMRSWYDNNLVKMIHFYKHVHGEPIHVLACGNELLVLLRGSIEAAKGIVAINKSNEEFQVNLPVAQYSVLLGGDDLLSQHTLTIPAQSGLMLMA